MTKVIITPSTTATKTARVDTTDLKVPLLPVMNIPARAMSKGNLPLQGTKLLVRMAISLSLGESIILQAITPAALQPKPMLMVKDCLP